MKLWKASGELFPVASIFLPTPYIQVEKSLRPPPEVVKKILGPPQ